MTWEFTTRFTTVRPIGGKAAWLGLGTGVEAQPRYSILPVMRAGEVSFFVLDTRTFRDPNFSPDGSGKTMIGTQQKAALKVLHLNQLQRFLVADGGADDGGWVGGWVLGLAVATLISPSPFTPLPLPFRCFVLA